MCGTGGVGIGTRIGRWWKLGALWGVVGIEVASFCVLGNVMLEIRPLCKRSAAPGKVANVRALACKRASVKVDAFIDTQILSVNQGEVRMHLRK